MNRNRDMKGAHIAQSQECIFHCRENNKKVKGDLCSELPQMS